MSQLVAGVPISGSFVDYSILYEYFTNRVGAFFNLDSANSFLFTRYSRYNIIIVVAVSIKYVMSCH